MLGRKKPPKGEPRYKKCVTCSRWWNVSRNVKPPEPYICPECEKTIEERTKEHEDQRD